MNTHAILFHVQLEQPQITGKAP